MNKGLMRLLARNKAKAGKQFASTVNKAKDSTEIILFDAIASDEEEAEWWGGVAPESFVKAVRNVSTPTLDLLVNSPGGSVFGARAMEQALRDFPGTVNVHITGLAASAATFLVLPADNLVMAPGAMWMIHKAWGMSIGNEDDHRRSADLLGKIDGTLAASYAKKTGRPVDEIAAWMRAETWFTAAEAKDAGFIDGISDEDDSKAAKNRVEWDLSAFASAPNMPKDESETNPGPESAPNDNSDHRSRQNQRIALMNRLGRV